MNSHADAPPRVLALLTDPRLRDEVRRIAAAADRPLDERTPPLARHPWAAASVIVLDTSAARCCVSANAPRRPGILLVTDGEPGLLDWQTATEIGAEQVLPLPTAADTLITAFAAHDQRGTGDGAVIAIAGAGGGAGASTLAAAVALAAAARARRRTSGTAGSRWVSPDIAATQRFRARAEAIAHRTLLVDAAALGGGLDLLLGLEKVPGLRWPDLVIEDGRVSADALHAALPVVAGTAVLSCGRGTTATELTPTAVHAVLEAGRSAGDLVVCDLSADRGAHTEQVLDSADLVILIVPARLRAIAAAESVAAYLAARNPHVHLIVRGPSPGGLRGREISETLALPLLAATPSQPGLAERLERGGLVLRPRGPLRLAAEAVLAALAEPDLLRPNRVGAPLALSGTR